MKKKVLFLANPHMSLYKEIEEELTKQGYEVFTFLDKIIKFDPFFQVGSIKQFVKKKCYRILKPHKNYWNKYIKNEPLLSKSFDFFLCIEGYSLDSFLIDHLKKNNPQIKSFLYLWDSSSFYDYFRHKGYFDEIFTFDRIDAINHNVSFLPLFWKEHRIQTQENKFLISSIGTNHDDRAFIIKKIMEQIQSLRLKNHYIKIIVPVKKHTLIPIIKYYVKLIIDYKNKAKIEELRLEFDKNKPDYCLTEYISFAEYYSIMYNTSIILDTDRPNQNGLSSRLIWALSLNKKILTTNTDIINYPFYNPDQIFIIDRKYPTIPKEVFQNQTNTFHSIENVMHLRLDNWVRNIINHGTKL